MYDAYNINLINSRPDHSISEYANQPLQVQIEVWVDYFQNRDFKVWQGCVICSLMTISFWIFWILFLKMAEKKVEVEDLLSVGDSVFTRCEGRDPIV